MSERKKEEAGPPVAWGHIFALFFVLASTVFGLWVGLKDLHNGRLSARYDALILQLEGDELEFHFQVCSERTQGFVIKLGEDIVDTFEFHGEPDPGVNQSLLWKEVWTFSAKMRALLRAGKPILFYVEPTDPQGSAWFDKPVSIARVKKK